MSSAHAPGTVVHLSPARRSTLAALAAVVLPGSVTTERLSTLVEQIERRLHSAPVHIRKDLELALDVAGSRIAALAVNGLLRSLPEQAQGQRARSFAGWATSSVAPVRTVHQALRKLILSSWYATTEGRQSIGVLPPLHVREPTVPWEGPLSNGPTRSTEPVSREPLTDAIRNPVRRVPDAITLASSFSGNISQSADVVVIGSGAGGAVAAARFAERGRTVIVLERGDFLHAADFTEDERLATRLYADQAMRTTSDASFTLLQGAVVGGGTTVNWMLMLRPSDEVIDEWIRMLGPDAFSRAQLDRHLDLIEREVRSSLVPSDAHAPSNQAILDGAAALGWRARTGSINAVGCVRAGTCSLGCRYDAKQSAGQTFLPRAFSNGARLIAGAEVERIEIVERNGRTGTPPLKRVHAVVRDASGAVRGRLTLTAPVVVLAAGAVETPVLLQRSGLAGGGVGRYLRLHPTTAVVGLHDRDMYPVAGIPQSALCDEFIRRDRHGHGFWIECPAVLPALASAALPGFGDDHLGLMRQMPRMGLFIVLVRDGSGSNASMGDVRLGRSGRTRIRFRLTSADRTNQQFGIEAAARLHLAAGARSAVSVHTPPVSAVDERGLLAMRRAPVSPNRVALFSAHVNGTCRLGTDRGASGCNPSGERHGVRGLYILDGSLLPTAPGVNPQETIMALSSLLAERALA
jgi:choline dehydrogenase-like flavoprotein